MSGGKTALLRSWPPTARSCPAFCTGRQANKMVSAARNPESHSILSLACYIQIHHVPVTLLRHHRCLDPMRGPFRICCHCFSRPQGTGPCIDLEFEPRSRRLWISHNPPEDIPLTLVIVPPYCRPASTVSSAKRSNHVKVLATHATALAHPSAHLVRL